MVRQSRSTKASAGALGQGGLQLARGLDRPPGAGPLGPVARDALGHLAVAGLAGDHDEHRAVPAAGQPRRQGRLAAGGAAEQQGQRHQ